MRAKSRACPWTSATCALSRGSELDSGELGFSGPPLPLDRQARTTLRLPDNIRSAGIALGADCLRGLVLELDDASDLRQTLGSTAKALSTSAPQFLWIVCALRPDAGELRNRVLVLGTLADSCRLTRVSGRQTLHERCRDSVRALRGGWRIGSGHSLAMARCSRSRGNHPTILLRSSRRRRGACRIPERPSKPGRAGRARVALCSRDSSFCVSRDQRMAQWRFRFSEQRILALHLRRRPIPAESAGASLLRNAEHGCARPLDASEGLRANSISQRRTLRPVSSREAATRQRIHRRIVRKRLRLPSLSLPLQRTRRLGRLVRSVDRSRDPGQDVRGSHGGTRPKDERRVLHAPGSRGGCHRARSRVASRRRGSDRRPSPNQGPGSGVRIRRCIPRHTLSNRSRHMGREASTVNPAQSPTSGGAC